MVDRLRGLEARELERQRYQRAILRRHQEVESVGRPQRVHSLMPAQAIADLREAEAGEFWVKLRRSVEIGYFDPRSGSTANKTAAPRLYVINGFGRPIRLTACILEWADHQLQSGEGGYLRKTWSSPAVWRTWCADRVVPLPPAWVRALDAYEQRKRKAANSRQAAESANLQSEQTQLKHARALVLWTLTSRVKPPPYKPHLQDVNCELAFEILAATPAGLTSKNAASRLADWGARYHPRQQGPSAVSLAELIKGIPNRTPRGRPSKR